MIGNQFIVYICKDDDSIVSSSWHYTALTLYYDHHNDRECLFVMRVGHYEVVWCHLCNVSKNQTWLTWWHYVLQHIHGELCVYNQCTVNNTVLYRGIQPYCLFWNIFCRSYSYSQNLKKWNKFLDLTWFQIFHAVSHHKYDKHVECHCIKYFN